MKLEQLAKFSGGLDTLEAMHSQLGSVVKAGRAMVPEIEETLTATAAAHHEHVGELAGKHEEVCSKLEADAAEALQAMTAKRNDLRLELEQERKRAEATALQLTTRLDEARRDAALAAERATAEKAQALKDLGSLHGSEIAKMRNERQQIEVAAASAKEKLEAELTAVRGELAYANEKLRKIFSTVA
jgi:chromosome segregation ATPase